MSVTKQQFIDGLNKALEDEYGATIQYVQHASLITEPEFQGIREEIIVHANEELNHAVILSKMIAGMGATPSVDISPVGVSKDSVVMLEQDLTGEKGAIELYTKLVAQAEELGESEEVIKNLKFILGQEVEHRDDLMEALGE